ncbi:MAG: hypothetical protein K2X27_15175 [Candidatus Obscuribacterales bacterium]|nr:hypothetical protein [Candidatus Obscuribacterales bacterium]
MNKTVELKLNHNHALISQNPMPQESKKHSVAVSKPECKNGVCGISWKPVKPAA